MKKLLFLLLAAVASVGLVQAQTTKVRFGIQGGLNLAEFSFSDEVFQSSNKTGFFIGPTLTFGIPVAGLGVDISALFNQKNIEIDDQSVSQSVKRKSVNVPVNVRYSIGFSEEACIYAAAGPQFSFNLGDENLELSHVDWTFKETALSFNVGGGLVISHLQLGASYNLPIGKTGEFEWNGETRDKIFHASSKSKGWQVSATWYF